MSTNDPVQLPVTTEDGGRVTRRQAMQWVMAAVAASAAPGGAFAQEVGRTTTPQEKALKEQVPVPVPHGYGVDPQLRKVYEPGAFWPLTLNDAQKKAATALADTILPEDKYGPAASDVGVIEMLDEWVSAPYPDQQADRPVILEGLAWIDAESSQRFGKSFADVSDDHKRAICDDVCYAATAKAELKKSAHFFSRFRSLAAAAYYATPQGWKAIGYVGNVQLPRFDGPPPEVLAKLGVTQTVQ